MSNIPDVPETLNQPDSAPSAETTNNQSVQPTLAEAPAPEARVEQDPASDAKEVVSRSSDAGDKDANKKATLLDVVKNGLEVGKPDSESSAEGEQTASADGEANEGSARKDEAAGSKETSQKAAEKVPFHNHPRWKEIVAEREALKPRAEQYDKITTFMKQNQLSEMEMVEGFKVMALMKHNPVEAYKTLQSHMQKLAPYTGEVLPEDLRKRVDEGFDSPESAKELARLRAEREFAAARQAELQKAAEENAEAERQKALVSAVNTWEQGEKAKDPDWSEKSKLVYDRIRSMVPQGKQFSASEAVEVARRALAEVNAALRPMAGRGNSIKSPTSSLSSASTRPAPRSLEDVVRLGLNV